MSVTRRHFLRAAGASALVLPAIAGRDVRAQGNPVFQHGVASGDPLTTRVVLWTRVTPTAAVAGRPVTVRWRVMADGRPSAIVASGTVTTGPDRDFTVKVDAGGLEPGRPYQYAFEALGATSAIGRTRTLPARTTRVRLASVSCSNYPAGFFNAYGALAARDDLDAVLHLGDYIYEFQNGDFGDGTDLKRVPDPVHEAVTLDDYRRRYATYRTDPDLQALHAKVPFIAIWDDHESADNAWSGGAANHDPWNGEGLWSTRRQAAARAYREWMPVREPAAGQPFRLYRSFRFGSLVSLAMLDTRTWRDGQAQPDDIRALQTVRRRLMGAEQEAWLFETMRAASRDAVTWSLVGQQVMFAPFGPIGRRVTNPDAWDGYQAERARLMQLFGTLRNVVVLTGDMHSSWAFDLPPDPWKGYRGDMGIGSVAVEFIAPAVSSPPYFTPEQEARFGPQIRAGLPHLRYFDGVSRGFITYDITPERLLAEFHVSADVQTRSAASERAAAFAVEPGLAHLLRA